jgi:hypothetical protein
MRKFILLAFSFCVLTFLNAQEQRVSILPKKNIHVITKDDIKNTNLYSNVSGFISAELYLQADSSFVVEINYSANSNYYKTRTEYTFVALQIYRDSLNEALSNAVDQSGRVIHLMGTTAVGLGYYSVVNTIATSNASSSGKLPLAAYMLSAGSSFFIPFYATQNKPFTLAQASMSFHGQTRGILYGMALSEVLYEKRPTTDLASYYYPDPEFYEESRKNRNINRNVLLYSGFAGSVGLGLANNYVAKKFNYSVGQASMNQLAFDFGTLHGLAYSEMTGMLGHNSKGTFGMLLASSTLYGFAGHYYAMQKNYSLGDAIVMRNTLFLGTSLTIPFLTLFELRNEDPVVYTMFAGSVLGALGGNYILQDKTFTTKDALMISLGNVTGGFFGLGTAFLIMPDSAKKPETWISFGGVIGAFAGSYLMYNYVESRPLRNNKLTDVSCALGVNPLGFMKTNYESSNAMPGVTLNVTF